MSWTDERVELLKKLWGEGKSASWIADEIGGVSRNAVIGKVHRLGLSGRAKTPPPPRAQTPGRPKTLPSKPAGGGIPSGDGGGSRMIVRGNTALALAERPVTMEVVAPRAEEVVVPISLRVTLVELREQMCRWPLGDPTTPEFRFCGARSPIGVPYCTHHAQLAYQPSQDRRREARVHA